MESNTLLKRFTGLDLLLWKVFKWKCFMPKEHLIYSRSLHYSNIEFMATVIVRYCVDAGKYITCDLSAWYCLSWIRVQFLSTLMQIHNVQFHFNILWIVNAQRIFFLPVLPLQVFYSFVALFLVNTNSFGMFNFNFSSPWMFVVIFYMFLKCSEYLTAYVVCRNMEILYQVVIWLLTLDEIQGVPTVQSHLYLVPCIYRAKFFRQIICKDSPHYHEPQIFHQKIISICFTSN
jgi:hypothetical protein